MRLLAIAIVIVALSLLVACGDAGTVRSSGGGTPFQDRADAIPVTAVGTVATVDGQTLVELPLGSRHGLKPGDFFRILDGGDRLKATVLVTEVIDADRCLARSIGSFDRNQSIAVGDAARFARDLSGLESLRSLETDLRRERDEVDRQDARTDAAHARLRTDYQKRLAELHERHLTSLAEQAAGHEQSLTDTRRLHASELARLQAEHRSALVALEAALTDQARRAVREERQRLAEESRLQRQERDRLQVRVDELLRGRKDDADRLSAAQARHQEEIARHRAAVTAEVETRQVLEERIAQLQARLEGRSRAERPVLSADPSRDETILGRLERITGERDAARLQAEDQGDRLVAAQRELEDLRTGLATLHEQIAALQVAHADAESSASERQALASELDALRRHARTVEIAQLRTERAYYDLAQRLLGVRDDSSLRDLQDKLRQTLDGVDRSRQEGQPKGEAP